MTTTPKKSKAAPADFSVAQKACRTPPEQEQLALVAKAGWTSAELHEYARLHFFKNGRDYPTALSYRRAIADLANSYRGLQYPDATLAAHHRDTFVHRWLTTFREGGSKPLPPRREGLLQRGRGQSHRCSSDEYAWCEHTEEYRALIEERARDYFKISADQPVHVNAWAASQGAYLSKLHSERRAAEKAARVAKKTGKTSRSPKKPKKQKLACNRRRYELTESTEA